MIYQIYPRSYQDSNGDGIGDLKGIIGRLPYIASLGVDAIWISPFFKSPMKDFGYDVSDYCDVDPMFGTLADFDALVAEAHRLGLRVMIDEVLSHTADDHPWFKESRSSRDNPKADWYVWADAKPDGTPPNNWLSIFGGSAWQWDTRRQQYYLHNFLAEQPDLNFHNRQVQDALLDVTRFWLERGVDGFRLDTINFYFHSQGLENNPALPAEERNDQTAPAVNPYNYQDHLYDKSRPENLGFLERFRALLDEYPAAAAVGEVGDSQRGLEVVAAYTAGGNRVHMCYAFDFLAPEKISARQGAQGAGRVRQGRQRRLVMLGLLQPRRDAACLALGRRRSRPDRLSQGDLGAADVAARLGLPLSGRGTGPRRGRPRLRGSAGSLRHPLLAGIQGPRRLPHADGLGRRKPNGGFSTAKPWLPVAEGAPVARGQPPAGRREIAARALPPLPRLPPRPSGARQGRHRVSGREGDAIVFARRDGNEQIVCAFNLGAEPADHRSRRRQSGSAADGTWLSGTAEGGKIKLGSYGAWFGRLA